MLEIFPKHYLVATPGQLPQPGQEETVVCLPVRMTSCKVMADWQRWGASHTTMRAWAAAWAAAGLAAPLLRR